MSDTNIGDRSEHIVPENVPEVGECRTIPRFIRIHELPSQIHCIDGRDKLDQTVGLLPP